MTTTAIAIVLHLLSSVIWVGGMFFAHNALRPSVMALEPPQRLALWTGVFKRFFAWVWLSVATLIVTGFFLVLDVYGGMAVAPMHIHLMSGLGLLMAAFYALLFFVPYQAFRKAMDAGDLPTAAKHQARIRQIITINLILGLITVTLGGAGGYLG